MAHYCKIHDIVFFKKGKMKGYAHPIVDEEGQDTGEWCNEEEAEETPKPSKKSEGYKADPETRVSIETQNAYSGVVALTVAGIVKRTEPLGQAMISYAANKLSNWYSQVEIKVDIADLKKAASNVIDKLPEFKTAVELVNYALSHGWKGVDLKLALTEGLGYKVDRPSDIKEKDIKRATVTLFPDKEVAKSKLVEEAKKLGAKEITPDQIPF